MARADDAALWRAWAPWAKQLDLILIDGTRRRSIPMRSEPDGYFSHEESEVADGQRYVLSLDGGEDRPDPCSLWQPDGTRGPSAVVRTYEFRWTDDHWQGVARHDLVFYELHVGTFTPEGTFEAIIPRLRELRELGVTAIELMPVGQFPGARNWGYDGVLPYAAQNTYGGPLGLAKLVDACHAEGLAVFLDVVYNHLGPEGNYLSKFGPYFTDKYKTPWGSAVNYDDRGADAVRDFVLDNARMWLDEFHLDGLRLDAVHAIYDLGARHVLAAIRDVADEVSDRTGRQITIVAESDLNDPRIIRAPEVGGLGLDAQWADDFHHVLHTFLTGENRGYYADYAHGGAEALVKVMRTPFLFAWEYSPHRGRKHGASPEGISGDHFVVCAQNHDQVGNRAAGDRLSTLVRSPAQLRLAASLVLLSPYVPLLFMGEEYGETNPFPFFCSFYGEELIQAVRQGRKREFADFHDGANDVVPDPDAPSTFESARLSWSWTDSGREGLRRLYADLLHARRGWPALRDFDHRHARLLPDTGETVLELVRGRVVDESLRALFNLSDRPQPVPHDEAAGRSILVATESAPYGGARSEGETPRELAPFECIIFGPATWQC